jgi:hypothetical protein
MTELKLSLALDFSRYPGPRYKTQGPNSGEKFRKHLVKLLKDYDRVIVDLDGTSGIGSSFLDEAFGGLVSHEGFSRSDVERRVIVKSNLDASYLATVSDSIRRAKLLADA